MPWLRCVLLVQRQPCGGDRRGWRSDSRAMASRCAHADRSSSPRGEHSCGVVVGVVVEMWHGLRPAFASIDACC